MENCCFAAVDMGTNSFHMIIAKLRQDGTIKLIDREKEMIRLGSHLGEDLSFISDEETHLAVRVLKKFKKLSDSYGAKFRAVATSAVREAKNKNQFIEEVRLSTGINIEVIDGVEEAEFIYLGADKALELRKKNALCIDIGGGSTEIINVDNGKKIFAESLKIGAVRLSKYFFPDFILDKERISDCREYISKLMHRSLEKYFDSDYEIAVGSSGTIEALALLVTRLKQKTVPDSFNSVSFSAADLKRVSREILSARTVNERLKIPGMEKKRADILPAGLLILEVIFELFRIKKITISGYALREGVIIDMMQNYHFTVNPR